MLKLYTLTCLLSVVLLSESVGAKATFKQTQIAQQPTTTQQDATRAAAIKATEEGYILYQQGTAESLRQAIEKWQQALVLWRKAGNKEWEIFTLVGIGSVYNDLGNKHEALKFLKFALPLIRAMDNKAGEATILNNIGSVYNDLGDRQQALKFLNLALVLRKEVADKAGEAITLNNIGLVYDNLGDKQQALQFYNLALSLSQQVEDKAQEATTLSNIGSVYNDLGDKQQALKFLNLALALRKEVEDKAGEATTLDQIGTVYNDLGDKQQAFKFYNLALALRKEVGDKVGEATTLNNIGSVYHELGDKQQAFKFYNLALALRKEVGDKAGEATTLNNIGSAYNLLGDRQQALNFYNLALALRKEVGDKAGEATTLSNIGSVYHLLGDRQQALNFYNLALPLRKEVGDKAGEATTLSNIGSVYNSLGNKQQALKFYNLALPLRKEVGDKAGEATTFNNIGTVYDELGDKQQALKFYNLALSLRKEVGDKAGEATTFNNIGTVYDELGDKQQALKFYNVALSLSQQVDYKAQEATTLGNIASLERDRGNLQAARTNVEAAIKIIEDLRTKIDSKELRTSYFATQQGVYKFYIDLLMELHKKSPSQGYDALALHYSERSRARSLIELLNEANAKIIKGANPKLLAKEQNLRQQIDAKDTLRINLQNSANKNDPITKTAIAKLTTQIENLLNQYQEIQAKIRTSNPAYAKLKNPDPDKDILKLPQIQQQLDQDTILLQYSLGEERSFLWVVSSNSLDTYELPKQQDIEKSAINLFCLISDNRYKPPSATDKENPCANLKTQQINIAAQELTQLILSPVKDKLGKKRLVIVADGALQYIPFAALADLNAPQSSTTPKPATETPKDNDCSNRSIFRPCYSIEQQNWNYQPLLANHEIVSLPSASSIAFQRQQLANRQPASKALAILADPVYSVDDPRLKATSTKSDKFQSNLELELERSALERSARSLNRNGWQRLVNTATEAKEILKLIPTESSLEALNFDANYNWATSKALNQFRILHFATHGFVNQDQPALSGIVLSLVNQQGKAISGYLRLADLFNQDYPAELIVLSACETGLGKNINGEGLVGLTRGLMYAGAARVAVSLWQVSDEGTSILMQEFYKQMLQQNKKPAEALRAAQLKLWQEGRSPYEWAAFTLQGEWR
ncbi:MULTISPECIES: CHAT domain-containing tetratricopeptide repeat protein [Calothrix]|uniref:CHAT domain-containing protein n=2 Tax=Calothrix TaxID=1186 RepID=A0ABR8ADE5_9CYAN|nr:MULTISPECIES: CHAT domain-containing tetratricopeptide repeat protein [Calothrix]MBD2197971.1 CHAT domain-containing protein [Calothrix parietina FACHB-288]MBD2226744.1 CHAT domain-containing protein [Calothrix anomala FACHB-343]